MTDPAELLTSNAVKSRAAELQAEADTLRKKHRWQSAVADLATLQAAEIQRLNDVIADHYSHPPRQPIFATISTSHAQNGAKTVDILVVDSHSDVWTIGDPDYAFAKWQRLPRLPTLSDMNERSEHEAADAAVARMLDAER
jgi:hypothetical protein